MRTGGGKEAEVPVLVTPDHSQSLGEGNQVSRLCPCPALSEDQRWKVAPAWKAGERAGTVSRATSLSRPWGTP